MEPRETSKTTDQDLRDNGYERDSKNENEYWRQEENGRWRKRSTDGDYSQGQDEMTPTKH